MTRNQIVLRPATVYRRRPLLTAQKSTSSSGSARLAEVAGGTTAECAAVCCCCPCGLVNLLVLAVYKVPVCLCRKALKNHRRRRLIKKGLMPLASTPANSRGSRCGGFCSCDETELHIHPVALGAVPEMGDAFEEVFVFGSEIAMEKELVELEKEMWDRFYATGFWRSPSQREA